MMHATRLNKKGGAEYALKGRCIALFSPRSKKTTTAKPFLFYNENNKGISPSL